MKFRVDYISKIDQDRTSVWVDAKDRQEAKDVVRHDYWDVMEIISVRPL